MAELFDIGGKAKTRKAKAPAPGANPAVARCVAAFKDGFARRFQPGILVLNAGLAGRKFKEEFLPAWGEEETLAVIHDFFFTTTDPRVTGSDYSFRVFLFNAQAIKLKRAGHTARKLDSRTQENIEAARRALR